MHLNCPHCRNPIEVVDPSVKEVLCPSCGSSFHLANTSTTAVYQPVERGQMFGRFAVHEKVGMGAFGTVYKAVDGDLHRTVAVKVPRVSNFGSSADGIDRFLREARSAAQLKHPNIVTVHEVGMQDQQPYLVSDFVDGVTLADWLTAHEPTFRQAAEWVAGLAEALHYAHQQGVVHRDVKPSNIMMTKGQHLYLMDFGLAKRDAGEITMTMEGQILGTPAYMSPEQARGEGHAVDGRADEYSLGVILYELLTRELPFRGNARMLLQQVMEDEPKPLRKINDRIPFDLETICLKAMSKEPTRRYPDCGHMATDLRRYLNGEPIAARPIGSMERAMKWVKRHRTLTVAALSTAAALLVGLGFALWQAKVAHGEAERAGKAEKQAEERADAIAKEKEHTEREKRKAQVLLGSSRVDRGMREWLDGNFYQAFVWFAEQGIADNEMQKLGSSLRYRISNYFRYSLGIKLTQLLVHNQPIIRADFSPDGQRFLTISGNSVRVWFVKTGLPASPTLTHQDLVNGASFSPDGRRIVTVSDDNTARVWEAASGRPLTVFSKHRSKVLFASFSNDGKLIVSAGCDEVAMIWDASNGKPMTPPLKHRMTVDRAVFSSDDSRVVTSCAGGYAQVWDSKTGKNITEPMQHRQIFVKASFSPDNRKVLTASWDNTARIWDATTGKSIVPALAHNHCVEDASFSPDGRRVVTASRDRTARVWDVETGQAVTPALIHQDTVGHAGFSPDGRWIITASRDNSARIWDASTGKPITPPLLHQRTVTCAQFSPDGRYLITGSWDRTLRVWEISNVSQHFAASIQEPTLDNHASFNRNGLVVSVQGSRAEVCDTSSNKLLFPPLMHQARVRHACFSPDATRIVTASEDKSARLWDAATGAPLTTPLMHHESVIHANFSHDGHQVVTVSEEKTARIWDCRTGQPLSPPLIQKEAIDHANFSSDGHCIITAYKKGNAVQMWDISADERAFVDILKNVQLHASLKIDETGGLQPIDVDKELLPWYKELKAKYPDEFTPKYEDTRRWRLKQIADCCKSKNISAAFFHQNWLLAEAVVEAARKR